MQEQGIDTVLEVTLQTVVLVEQDSEQFSVLMGAHSRLITTQDSAVIDERDFQYQGPAREMVDWRSEDSESFREALDAAEQDLASQIVDNIFELDAVRAN